MNKDNLSYFRDSQSSMLVINLPTPKKTSVHFKNKAQMTNFLFKQEGD